MTEKVLKGSCLARGQETSALCSPCFRKSVALLTLQPMKGGESWADRKPVHFVARVSANQ